MLISLRDILLSKWARLVVAITTICMPMATYANRTMEGQSSIASIKVSPDGNLILAGSMDATTKLWDVRTGKNIYTLGGHNGGITSVAFSPDSKKILVGSADGTIKLYE